LCDFSQHTGYTGQEDTNGGKRKREGATSGMGRLERMKHGSGINDRDDRSRGIEILMTDVFVKINPTEVRTRIVYYESRKRGTDKTYE
jgi:hypothetical protein